MRGCECKFCYFKPPGIVRIIEGTDQGSKDANQQIVEIQLKSRITWARFKILIKKVELNKNLDFFKITFVFFFFVEIKNMLICAKIVM